MALEILSKLIHLRQRRSHCRIRQRHILLLRSPLNHSVSALFHFLRFEPSENMTLPKGPRNTSFLHKTLQFLLPYQLFQIFCSNCVSLLLSCVAKIQVGGGGAYAIPRHR